MKNYKEVAYEVARRSDKVIAADRKRKQNIIKVCSAASVFCLAAVIGVGVWYNSAKPYTFDGYKTVSMNASWTHAYVGIKGLCKAENLDLIARVKIGDGIQESRYGLNMTVFTAKVEDLIYSSREDNVDNVNIIMTGWVDHDTKTIHEIAGDPLMKKGDEFIIFAQKNESGTYTVLGGPQGRFLIENDTVYPLYKRASQSDAEKANAADKNIGESVDDFVEKIRSYI